MEELMMQDPGVAAAISREIDRQMSKLELIASENFTSTAVRQAMGSCLTHKYAEGSRSANPATPCSAWTSPTAGT